LANKTIIEKLKNSMADLEIRSPSRLYFDFNINVQAKQEAFRGIKSSFQCPFILEQYAGSLKALV
jgi:hypothetical protein